MTPKLEKHVGNFSCLSGKQGSPITRSPSRLHSPQIDLEVMLCQRKSYGSGLEMVYFYIFEKIKCKAYS